MSSFFFSAGIIYWTLLDYDYWMGRRLLTVRLPSLSLVKVLINYFFAVLVTSLDLCWAILPPLLLCREVLLVFFGSGL